MEQTTYNEFIWNDQKVYQKTTINENGVDITQSYSPFESTGKPDKIRNDDEVTHDRFFGENIARVIRAFRGK